MAVGQPPLNRSNPAVGPAIAPAVLHFQQGNSNPNPLLGVDMYEHHHIFLQDGTVPAVVKLSGPASRLMFTLGAARVYVKFGQASAPAAGFEDWCDLVLPAVAENPATADPFKSFIVPGVDTITFGMAAPVNDDYHVWAYSGSYDRP